MCYKYEIVKSLLSSFVMTALLENQFLSLNNTHGTVAPTVFCVCLWSQKDHKSYGSTATHTQTPHAHIRCMIKAETIVMIAQSLHFCDKLNFIWGLSNDKVYKLA